MKLSKLVINNYKSCRGVEINCLNIQALVGYNNSGKSNILSAIDFLLSPSTTKLDEYCFWNGNTTEPISVEAEFTHLSPTEKEKLAPYLVNDELFYLRRTAIQIEDENGDTKFSISASAKTLTPSIPWLNPTEINGANVTSWWANKEEMVVDQRDFYSSLGTKKPTVSEWKEKAQEFCDELDDSYFTEVWNENPRGLPNVLKSSLPNVVFIPTVRDLSDETKVQKTNPFGQLLKAIVDKVSGEHIDKINASVDEISKLLNKIGGDTRIPSIAEIESRLNHVFNNFMPGVLEIEFDTPTIDTLFSAPRIVIDDGFRNDARYKGHGMQRAIIFSIIKSYADLITADETGGDKRTVVFLIEEPELYMHPNAQESIKQALNDITSSGDQVYFSTHSPKFIDVEYFDRVIKVTSKTTKVDDLSTINTFVMQLKIQDLMDDLKIRFPSTSPTEDSIRDKYMNAYHPNRSEGFFAEKVLLVEGPTESYSLPIYADKLGVDLPKNNISIVECGGKLQMDRLYQIFNELGIACFVLFDYDKSNTESKSVDYSKVLTELILGEVLEPVDSFHCEKNVAYFPEKYEDTIEAETKDFRGIVANAKAYYGLSSDEIGKPLRARYVALNTPLGEIPPSISVLFKQLLRIEWQCSCLLKPEADEVS